MLEVQYFLRSNEGPSKTTNPSDVGYLNIADQIDPNEDSDQYLDVQPHAQEQGQDQSNDGDGDDEDNGEVSSDTTAGGIHVPAFNSIDDLIVFYTANTLPLRKGKRVHLREPYRQRHSASAVLAMVSACQAAATLENENGDTPLHIAIEKKAPDTVVSALVAAMPGLQVCMAYLRQGPELDVDAFLAWFDVHKNDGWIDEENKEGNTALHAALKNNVPEAVLLALIGVIAVASPPLDTCKKKDADGNTPLDFVLAEIKKQAVETVVFSEAVLLLLISACPTACMIHDEEGHFPLHHAVELHTNKYAPEVTEAVLLATVEGNPDAIKEQSARHIGGNTPLHVVLQRNASEAVVSAMIKHCPAAVKVKNSRGITALEIGLSKKVSETVLLDLIASCPDSVKEIQKSIAKQPLPVMEHEDISIGEALGNGNFGEVKRGTIISTGQPVAVKTCKKDTAQDSALFLKEADIFKDFDHPNVVKLIGVVSTNPVYIILELCKDELLAHIRKHGKLLEVGDFIRISSEVAEGIHYLHVNNCIHRDVAARNCLIGSDGSVKVSDFGLSRIVSKDGIYKTTMIDRKQVAPIKWAAPEVISRKSSFVLASDVWAFGILLWEIFSSGKMPYPGMSKEEVMDDVMNHGYRMDAPPGTPSEVKQLMDECWQHKEQDRPTMTAIADLFLELKVLYPETEAGLVLFDFAQRDIHINSGDGSTLLHAALTNRAPEAVILKLINEWPDSVKVKNDHGIIPLHIALKNCASPNILSAITKVWEDSIKVKDSQSVTPLMIALENSVAEKCVLAYVKVWPGAVQEKNANGDTPLHVALLNNAPEAIVDALIKIWPDGVKEVCFNANNSVKHFPLQIALTTNASFRTVDALIKAWPDAVNEGVYGMAAIFLAPMDTGAYDRLDMR